MSRNNRAKKTDVEALPVDGGKPGYFDATRRYSVSLLFSLPLLAVYEIGAFMRRSDSNAAAAILKTPISWLQRHPVQVFGADLLLLINSLLIVGIIAAVIQARRIGALRIENFAGMLGESVLYALLLGPLALAPITGRINIGGFSPQWAGLMDGIFLSAGAGFYEELFFRAILLGSIYYVARRGAGLKPFVAGIIALVASGGIFSTAHFLNPGEDPDLGAFLYRLTAGMLLGLIYLSRGLGIAAWTHALYDVYVLCFAR
jgi:membrane protease YdiL (CAAX protease family)